MAKKKRAGAHFRFALRDTGSLRYPWPEDYPYTRGAEP